MSASQKSGRRCSASKEHRFGLRVTVTLVALCVMTAIGIGQAAVLRMSGDVLGESSMIRTSSVVVSADAAVRSPRKAANVRKSAAPAVQSIAITKSSGGGNWYFPWDRIELKAVATFEDGTKGEVDAEWNAKEWYRDRASYGVPGCSATATCRLPGKLDNNRYDITATYDGKTSPTVEISFRGEITVQGELPQYTDALPDWAAKDIGNAGLVGIMTGYSDGRFGAEDTVSNAQFAVMLVRLAHILDMSDRSTTCPQGIRYPEGMTSEHFAYPAFCFFISKAYDLRWALNLNAPITRLQAAYMITDTIGAPYFLKFSRSLDSKIQSFSFTDVPQTLANTRVLNFVTTQHIMGYDSKAFRPNDSLNRAEAAVIIMRTLEAAMQR